MDEIVGILGDVLAEAAKRMLTAVGAVTVGQPQRLPIRSRQVRLSYCALGSRFGERCQRDTDEEAMTCERVRGERENGGRRRAAMSPAGTARATPPSTRCAASRSTCPRAADGRHGPVRLRQVDADAHPRRARQADLRQRHDRRHGDHDARRQRSDEAPPRAHRLRLPVLQPAADADAPRRTSSCR